MTERDPRIFFAGERTLLAWIRTGITIMAFGFVVARFGLFLRLVAAQGVFSEHSGANQHVISSFVGVTLVLLGSGVLLFAAGQHRSFCRGLNSSDIPSKYAAGIPVIVASALGVLGIVLACLLVL